MNKLLFVIAACPLFSQTVTVRAVTNAANNERGTALSSADYRQLASNGLAIVWGDGLAEQAISAFADYGESNGPPNAWGDGVQQVISGSTFWPKKLGSTEVHRCSGSDCQPLGLLFVSPGQIIFQLPNFNGSTMLRVVNGAASELVSINLSSRAVAIFEIGYDCAFNPLWGDPSTCGLSQARSDERQPTRGAIIDVDGKLVLSSVPAVLNGYYTVWFTGLGGVPRSSAFWPVVYVSGLPHSHPKSLRLTNFGESSQLPGFYQMNFQIPPEIMGGLYPSGEDERPTCADYRLELSLFIAESKPIQIPVFAKNGEFDCRK